MARDVYLYADESGNLDYGGWASGVRRSTSGSALPCSMTTMALS